MSKFFNDDIIEQIKNANDIVSVISEHIPLKKKGKNSFRYEMDNNPNSFSPSSSMEYAQK